MKTDANNPCKNLEIIYVPVFISVWAKKLQHWANIERPLNAIMKLHNEARIISGILDTLDIWLHPIVISNKPLIKEEHKSRENPNIDNGM